MAKIIAADFILFGLLWTMNMPWTELWVERNLQGTSEVHLWKTVCLNEKTQCPVESAEQCTLTTLSVSWWSCSSPLLQGSGMCLSCFKGVSHRCQSKFLTLDLEMQIQAFHARPTLILFTTYHHGLGSQPGGSGSVIRWLLWGLPYQR